MPSDRRSMDSEQGPATELAATDMRMTQLNNLGTAITFNTLKKVKSKAVPILSRET